MMMTEVFIECFPVFSTLESVLKSGSGSAFVEGAVPVRCRLLSGICGLYPSAA